VSNFFFICNVLKCPSSSAIGKLNITKATESALRKISKGVNVGKSKLSLNVPTEKQGEGGC
jgi:hypothetical protein